MNRAQHIARARLDKATALLASLRTLPDFPGRDEMESWPAESWCILATIAGVNAPSPETRELVIRMATEGRAA